MSTVIKHTGQALKAIGADRVGGYLVVFNSRDLQDEYFTADTDFALDLYETRPLLYQHGLDDTMKTTKLGVIDTLRADDVGLWMEAQLTLRNQYKEAVDELLAMGALGLSSGSMPHLVQVDDDGHIRKWPLFEGSATPTPAEPQTSVTFIKAVEALDGLFVPAPAASAEGVSAESAPAVNAGTEAAAATDEAEAADASSEDVADKDTSMNVETLIAAVENALGITLDDAQRQQLIAELNAQANPAPEAAAAAVTPEMLAMRAIESVQKIVEQRKAADAVKAALSSARPASQVTPSTPRVTDVVDLRLDHMSAADLVYGAHFLSAAGKNAGPEWMKAARIKSEQEADRGLWKESGAAIKNTALKADEITATNLSGNGGNWVGTMYDNMLWEKVRQAPIYQQLISAGMRVMDIGQGFNQAYIPTEGTDPVFYSLVELNDITTDELLPVTGKASTIAPTQRLITLGGLAARVAFSDIMEEDTLIPLIPFVRSRMETVAQEQVEYVLLNGDTATGASTNINLIDGTPSLDSKSRGPSYLAFNGFLKLPLVTTTALSRDAGVSFDETDYLETLKLLPTTEREHDKLFFVVDYDTYYSTLNIASVKTRDVFQPATLESGALTRMYGIPVLYTARMFKANSAGKVPNAGGTLGRVLLVRPDQWVLARKRDVRTEVWRDSDAQATVVNTTLRLGLQSRTTTGGAAVSYNVALS